MIKSRDSLVPDLCWPSAAAWCRPLDAPAPDAHRMIRDVRAWVRYHAGPGVWPTVVVRCGYLLCAPAPESALRLEIAHVMAHGATAPRAPWIERADPWCWHADAIVRHLGAWTRGDVTDPDSGASHLAHTAARCLILHAQIRLDIGVDDRP